MRRTSLAALAAIMLVSGCQKNTDPTTGAVTTTVSPFAQLGFQTIFTLAQGAAKAYLGKPSQAATAAKVQSLLSAMQSAWVAWSANPTTGNAEAIAVQAAEQALLEYMIGQGINVTG